MKQYKWASSIIIISNIILGIKALIWVALSTISTFFNLQLMCVSGIEEHLMYAIADNVFILIFSGAIPILMEIYYSITIRAMSKRWIKYDLPTYQVASSVDSCLKTIILQIEVIFVFAAIMSDFDTYLEVDMMLVYIKAGMILLCVILCLANVINLILINRIPHK